ncbi:hypothetical protein NM688_g1726 [Phlebia brevispora]|uniref:Uncharacterized protein n=1 Tax=Phlebia brevispora TaxID=194682 RepID=A0ACC1TAS9_9APHY|nr:hypothetical protein NM688_g1726 [Phlebia brevispora]
MPCSSRDGFESILLSIARPRRSVSVFVISNQGVEEWRLYDIAAVFPLILQVSLVLFFVGLCFFTASVHSSIGTTSVVLVSAWAAFIVFAILVPQSSPRCPFKITSLVTIFNFVRPRLYHLLQSSMQVTTSSRRMSEDSADLTFMRSLTPYALQEDSASREEAVQTSDANDLIILRNVDAIFLDDDLLTMIRGALRRRRPPGCEAFRFVVSILQHRMNIPLQQMDGQLGVVPWPWTLSYSACVSLINVLADSLLLDSSLHTYLETWELDLTDNWFRNAVVLIFKLTSPQNATPNTVTSLFRLMLTHPGKNYTLFDLIASQFSSDEGRDGSLVLAHTFASIIEVLKMYEINAAGWALQCIAYDYFRASQHPLFDPDIPLGSILITCVVPHASDDPPSSESVLFVEVAAALLHGLTTPDNPSNNMRAFGRWCTTLLELTIAAIQGFSMPPGLDLRIAHIHGGVGLDRLLSALFLTPGLDHACLEFYSVHFHFLLTEQARAFLLNPVQDDNLSRESIVSILSTCESFFKITFDSDTALDLAVILSLCNLIHRLSYTVRDRDVNKLWHSTFSSIANCAKKFHALPSQLHACQHGQDDPHTVSHSDVCRAAHANLRFLEEIAIDGQPTWHSVVHSPDPAEEAEAYSLWLRSFNITLSRVPDELISVLRWAVCPAHRAEHGCKFWRIRRLEEMESQTGLSLDIRYSDATTSKATAESVVSPHAEMAVHGSFSPESSIVLPEPEIPTRDSGDPAAGLFVQGVHAQLHAL